MTQGSFILTMAVQSPVVHLLTNRLGLSSFTIPRRFSALSEHLSFFGHVLQGHVCPLNLSQWLI